MLNIFEKMNQKKKLNTEDSDYEPDSGEGKSILDKYKEMKKKMNEVNEIIVKVANFCEKVKNIVFWKDP